MPDPFLEGMPSPQETMQALSVMEPPQTAPAQDDFLQGMPSPQETMQHLQELGINPGNLNAAGFMQAPGADQRYRSDITNVYFPQGVPASRFNPISRAVESFYTGAAQMASMPLNLTSGMDVSGQFAEHNKGLEEAYQKRFGRGTPLTERMVTGAVDSLLNLMPFSRLGKAGAVIYMGEMGIRGYDDGLKEAADQGITGAQKHAYAGVNAASEVLTEFIPWKKEWGALAEVTSKQLKKQVTSALWHLFVKGGQEAAEEGINKIIQNGNAAMHGMQGWNQLLDGVAEAAGVGGIVGGVVSTPRAVQHHREQIKNERGRQAAWGQWNQITGQNPQGVPQPGAQTFSSSPGQIATQPTQQGQWPATNPEPTNAPTAVPATPPGNVVQQTQAETEVPRQAAEGETAATPELTEGQREHLKLLGLKDEQIDNMTPEQLQISLKQAQELVTAPAEPSKKKFKSSDIQKMERRLKDNFGFTQAQIKKMTPEQMQETLAQPAATVEQPEVRHVPPPGEKPVVTPETGNVDLRRSLAEAPPTNPAEMTPEQRQQTAEADRIRHEQQQRFEAQKAAEQPKSAAVQPQPPKITGEKPFALETKPKPETKKQDFGVNKSEGKPLFLGAKDLPGQQSLVPDEGATLGPEKPKISGETPQGTPTRAELRKEKARKYREHKKARQQAEKEDNTIYRVADSEEVSPTDLRDAVDRQIAADRENYNALKEAVGKGVPKEEAQKLREGDVQALPKQRLDELRHSLEEEGGELRHLGISFDEALNALKHGLPAEPSLSNEDYVRHVAGIMKQEGEAAGSTSFNPAEFAEDVSFYGKRKGVAASKPRVMPQSPQGYPKRSKAEPTKPIEIPKLEPKAGESEPINENAVRDALSKLFDVPIFRGRMKPLAHGQYQWGDKVIRLSNEHWANIVIATHEIGHSIDDQTKFLKNATPEMQAELLDPAFNQVNDKDQREGFAEFMRKYLTTDAEAQAAPHTLAAFEKVMKDNPELGSKVKQAKELIDKLRTRSPMDAVLSQQNAQPVELADNRSTWDKVMDQAQGFLTGYMERMGNSDYRILQLANKAAGGVDQAFYSIWNRLTGSHLQRTFAALAQGVRTISGDKQQQLSESIRDIYSEIKPEEKDELSAYTYAKVFLHRMDRVPGYNPGRTRAELEATVKAVEADADKHKRLDDAARRLRPYFLALQKLEANEGLHGWDDVGRMEKADPDYYAPVFPDRGYGVERGLRGLISGAAPGLLTAKKTARRLRGGSSDTYLPLHEAIIRATANTYQAATKAAIANAFLRRLIPSLGGAHGFANYITEVDPKILHDTVALERILDSLTSEEDAKGRKVAPLLDKDEAQLIKDVGALRRGKLGKDGLKRLADEFGTDDEKALLAATADVRSLQSAIGFFKTDFGRSENEHVIFYHIAGKNRGFQIKSAALWRAMAGMRSPAEAHLFSGFFQALADGWNNRITKPIQSLAVGFSPTAVGRLFFQDYPGFIVQSKYTGAVERWYAPLYNIVRLAGAMAYEDAGHAPQWAKAPIQGILKLAAEREIKAGLILKGEQTGESGTVTSGKLFGYEKTLKGAERIFLPLGSHKPGLIGRALGRIPGTGIVRSVWDKAPSLETIRDHIAVLDSGIRLAEMQAYARGHGYTINKDASFADIEAGKNTWIDPSGQIVDAPPSNIISGMLTAQNEVIINYKPKGYVAAEIGKFVPFFTATMAGAHKGISTVAELGRGAYRKGWKGVDPGTEAFAARMAGMAGLATLNALYWWFHRDDENREGMDPRIANRFWTFDVDGVPYAKIPKPREYGIFLNAMDDMMDLVIKQKNPQALDTLKVAAAELSPVQSYKPGDWVAGASTLYQLYQSEEGSDWKGAPIDAPWQVEKHMSVENRRQPYTSDTATAISQYFTKYLNLSPNKTEYLLDQISGNSFRSILGTSEFFQKGELRNLPIIRGEATRGLYQSSPREFYDEWNKLDGAVADGKEIRGKNPPTNIDIQNEEKLQQMTRYKHFMSEVRKAGVEAKDTDKKLDLDRYVVGLADYATGKDERENYPNPLRKGVDVPNELLEARNKFMQSLIHALSTTPNPDAIRTPDQAKKFPERLQRWRIERTWAAQELKRLGYTPADASRMLMIQQAKLGRNVKQETEDEVLAGMAGGE